jgi:hypothetical protein
MVAIWITLFIVGLLTILLPALGFADQRETSGRGAESLIKAP